MQFTLFLSVLALILNEFANINTTWRGLKEFATAYGEDSPGFGFQRV